MDFSVFINYAPVIVVVVVFCLKSKLFITPKQLEDALEKNKASCKSDCKEKYVTKEDMQLERKELLEEVRKEFLQTEIFKEFAHRIDDNFKTIDRRFSDSSKRFDKIDENLEHIKDILINKK